MLGSLRQIRRTRDMSQAELASAAGISRQAVSNLERGVSHARSDSLQRIASALDVTVDELLEEPELPKASTPSPPVDRYLREMGDFEQLAEEDPDAARERMPAVQHQYQFAKAYAERLEDEPSKARAFARISEGQERFFRAFMNIQSSPAGADLEVREHQAGSRVQQEASAENASEAG